MDVETRDAKTLENVAVGTSEIKRKFSEKSEIAVVVEFIPITFQNKKQKISI